MVTTPIDTLTKLWHNPYYTLNLTRAKHATGLLGVVCA